MNEVVVKVEVKPESGSQLGNLSPPRKPEALNEIQYH